MDGYTINFGEAQQAAEQLSTILDDLAQSIQSLDTVEKDLLSDANWKGPNKSTYQAEFSEYKVAASKLHENGVEHLQALRDIIARYASAEQ